MGRRHGYKDGQNLRLHHVPHHVQQAQGRRRVGEQLADAWKSSSAFVATTYDTDWAAGYVSNEFNCGESDGDTSGSMAIPIGVVVGGVVVVLLVIIAAVVVRKKNALEASQGRNLPGLPAVQVAPREVEMNDIPLPSLSL